MASQLQGVILNIYGFKKRNTHVGVMYGLQIDCIMIKAIIPALVFSETLLM